MRLTQSSSKKQLTSLHFINNFDFYWKNGDFHPPTILSHFSSLLDSSRDQYHGIRTWGHVEWRNEEEILEKLEGFEEEVNRRLPGMKAIAVCAYDTARLSENLKSGLLRTHKY
ncbi:MEDS domain-containing protein [Peribacillus kribbensis]|uniref:MEDS domain-containing protein n=1 Tax=Peribacillus kribbensis TaxID=356658 RepID=UPI00047B5277|nr:MEDS domain-containing protein [Peribacillus kribbensis]